jgi:Fe2+ transport system protein FeoA
VAALDFYSTFGMLASKSDGPILIETSTQRVAVGHGIARRIMVKELSDEH